VLRPGGHLTAANSYGLTARRATGRAASGCGWLSERTGWRTVPSCPVTYGYLYPGRRLARRGVFRPLPLALRIWEPAAHGSRPGHCQPHGGSMKLRIVRSRAVAWRDRSRARLLALSAAGALAVTAATARAPRGPSA